MTIDKTHHDNALRLYQVSYGTWEPPLLVAARSFKSVMHIATRNRAADAPRTKIAVIDVTDQFLALSSTAEWHTNDLLARRAEWVIRYDDEDGWSVT